MPKEKERTVNPAQQQRRLEKAKALKKGKAELQARRNEKLARRNPDRLQRQIDELKALEQSGSIKAREKQILEELEKDLRAVKKAREALGEKAPHYGNRSGPPSRGDGDNRGKDAVLGKRKWDGNPNQHRQMQQEQGSGSETDESVRRIPMPKDTPPPMLHRRNDRQATNANAEPLSSSRAGDRKPYEEFAGQIVTLPKTTYESAPQIRDLRKEAISRFVPDVVRKKQDALKGTGRLMEPEELDKLEREGYRGQKDGQSAGILPQQPTSLLSSGPVPDAKSRDDDAEARRMAEEEERFQRDMHHMEMEEVQDEDL